MWAECPNHTELSNPRVGAVRGLLKKACWRVRVSARRIYCGMSGGGWVRVRVGRVSVGGVSHHIKNC